MELLKNTWKHRALVLMALPAVALLIMFSYIPMGGLVLAFKTFDYQLVFDSPWCGLNNFRYIFLVGDTFWRLTRNTILYYIMFTIVGTVGKVALAIGINEFFHMAVVDWGLIMAAGVMVTIPALVFFIAVQRYLIAGWGAGGLKG